MTKIPKISKALQKKNTGKSAAIVNGKIVAFGKNSYVVAKKAEKMGFKRAEIMTTFIMGRKNYALHLSLLRR